VLNAMFLDSAVENRTSHREIQNSAKEAPRTQKEDIFYQEKGVISYLYFNVFPINHVH
jgi:hypothetical protein